MILFLGLDAHWTNRSREKPHSRSGTLASTAYSEGEMWRCEGWGCGDKVMGCGEEVREG